MKKHKLPALAAALCLLCAPIPQLGKPMLQMTAVRAADDALTFGDLTYVIEGDAAIITGCDGTATTVEIPEKIDGKPVTTIAPTSFYGCALTELTIPEGVTSIGSGAFQRSDKLKSVKLPSTLTSIEMLAFNNCTALESINIPESVTYIGQNAFADTAWLAAQREQSPFVVVNGILIDAEQAVIDRLNEIDADKERRIEEIRASKTWNRNLIMTNQIGYFTDGAKQATLVTDAKDPVKFELLDNDGKVVFTEDSIPFGADTDSGDNVQILDFSEFNTAGTYTLKAGEAVSKAFKIGITEDYSGLWTDAMNYFYQNRSGVAIEEEYITSGNKAELARAAGHAPDVAEIQQVWDYTGTEGTQDVTGGWYDAGDHGKYVVNGGISLWLMQNEYERASLVGKADAYQDGMMQIPENSNGFPDLLDEARFEMDWMLKMIVQDGDCKGMAYHKVHDDKWTALGTSPANDRQARYLLPPSTAATLNLAAVGAQSYRLWKELDPDYAKTCLDAAKAAYTAAQAHPEMYAPNKEHGGGGAYNDSNVTDEFYWAACELFAATGDEAYLADAKSYGDGKLAQSILLEDKTGSFDWGNTRALGSLTLSLYAGKLLDADDTATVVKSIMDAADTFMTYTSEQGYGLPYQGAKDKNGYAHYAWGSNSFIADNAIILAYAYDQSGQQSYLNGVTAAMDYILGRNPLDFSYVTGYGEHSGQYPHHRFWAKNLKSAMPKAPCGVLLGGANSNLQDPIMQDGDFVLGETPALLCHADNIEAYSVNECAVNWNSPLAWVTSYLCEQNGGLTASAPSVGVQKEEPPKEDEILDEAYPVAITLPEGITAVGEQIFGKSKGYVTEVTVPDNVALISKDAFSGCTKLSSLNLPETIEEVGDEAFKGTPWLKSQLADSPLLIINGLLIDGTASKGDVVIPDGVTSILGGAFKQNKNITSVTIPEGVTNIGSSAFHSCEALTAVTLPESLRTIGESAFASTGLTELTIPAGVRQIDAEAFINTLDLPEVTILANGAKIGAEAFGCTSTFTANGQYTYIFVHRVREDFVVNCVKGSTAAAYAGATGVQVNYLASDAAILGDVNGDGGVDIMDVILLNKYVLGVETLTDDQKKAADVDAGGEIDSTDSLNILKYVVELIDGFYAL